MSIQEHDLSNNELTKNFGTRLAFIRIKKSMTQEQLAEAAEISTDFLSLIERGLRAPSFLTLERLARALGVEVKELFIFDHMTDI
jgi:transcriptional regulator with XRE-family HTH domain